MSFTLKSGLKIFDIIEVLWQNPKSREEFRQKLKEKGIEAESKTVSKYMATLRGLGFEIKSKKCNLFEIYKTPFKTKINQNESLGLSVLFSSANQFFKEAEDYAILKYKFLNLFEFQKDFDFEQNEFKDLNLNFSKKTSDIVKSLSNFIYPNPSFLKIETENKNLLIIPREIKFKKNGIFLNYLDKETEEFKTINVNLIKKIKKSSSIKEKPFKPLNETVFKITGPLRKNYILREGEIANYKNEEVLITNFYEPKEELFKRLIKYGKYCEIIYPESDRIKIASKIKSLIKHYSSM